MIFYEVVLSKQLIKKTNFSVRLSGFNSNILAQELNLVKALTAHVNASHVYFCFAARLAVSINAFPTFSSKRRLHLKFRATFINYNLQNRVETSPYWFVTFLHLFRL